MQRLEEIKILYHGSYCEVVSPDLSKGGSFKDFGRGFYLTSSCDQARRFVRLSLQKAVSRGTIAADADAGYVSSYELRTEHLKTLRRFLFETANEEWLHCVVGHRKEGTFPEVVRSLEEYDVIGGKIANDNTNATITTYMTGGYGEIGSADADRLCISFLLPERLEDQFCFRSHEALNCLAFQTSEKVWIT